MSITQLQPAAVWHYFDKLCQIPRPSYHETAVQQFVLDEAARLGLAAERDAVGNIVVRKPATAGMEHCRGVILQNHLDMVAQKNHDSDHDFTRDPIQAYIDGDWVRARGTTLGADNGIGAAAALAVLASTDIAHGEIEALFTASEESGMDGALGLQGGWLRGDILLNLDTEILGEVYIGCAGGVDGTFQLPLQQNAVSAGSVYELTIRGLKGGHSGIHIHLQRGNALKLLVHILLHLHEHIAIADLHGGNLRNAIPREADALFVSTQSLSELQQRIDAITKPLIAMLPAEDQNVRITLTASNGQPAHCWTLDCQNTVLNVLHILPNGADSMNRNAIDLVETSTNLARIHCNENTLTAECLLRSQNDFARDELGRKMGALFTLAGGSAQLHGAYAGWQPVFGSPLTQLVVDEGAKLLGRTPNIAVIHAGLECGILGTHYPHWQMVSFGPTVEMPHSPEERLHIQSVEVFWQWLVNILGAVRTLS